MNEPYRPKGRIYLYPSGGPGGRHRFTSGTFADLKAEGIEPCLGMHLKFYADDGNDKGEPDYLLFDGVVGYEAKTETWYAIVDDYKFWREPDEGPIPSR